MEDDIVVEYVFGMLEDRDNPVRFLIFLLLPLSVTNFADDGFAGSRLPIRRRCKSPS